MNTTPTPAAPSERDRDMSLFEAIVLLAVRDGANAKRYNKGMALIRAHVASETSALRAENAAAKTLIKSLEYDLKWAKNELECGAKNAERSCLELFQQRDEARTQLTAAQASLAESN